jgi:hypothetical protein
VDEEEEKVVEKEGERVVVVVREEDVVEEVDVDVAQNPVTKEKRNGHPSLNWDAW